LYIRTLDSNYKTMNIYITRHGETEWNTVKRMQGWGNSNLTQLGKMQAKALSDRLKNVKLDVIYCSPLGRACSTAEIIRGDKKVDIVKVEGLKEMGFGQWEGKTVDEIKKNKSYKEQLEYLYSEPFKYKPFGGESIVQMYERVKSTLDKLINNSPFENILIVTHGMTIQGIMHYFSKKVGVDIDNVIYGQTSLTYIKIDEDKYEMLLNNDTTHYGKIAK
ncbi:MAG: histidine phosphatase family protein, partial [Sarcina sp.]